MPVARLLLDDAAQQGGAASFDRLDYARLVDLHLFESSELPDLDTGGASDGLVQRELVGFVPSKRACEVHGGREAEEYRHILGHLEMLPRESRLGRGDRADVRIRKRGSRLQSYRVLLEELEGGAQRRQTTDTLMATGGPERGEDKVNRVIEEHRMVAGKVWGEPGTSRVVHVRGGGTREAANERCVIGKLDLLITGHHGDALSAALRPPGSTESTSHPSDCRHAARPVFLASSRMIPLSLANTTSGTPQTTTGHMLQYKDAGFAEVG